MSDMGVPERHDEPIHLVAPDSARGDTMIEAHHVDMVFSKGSATTPVLQDVSLAIRSGSFVSLLGPSGCGKSTLLKILGGLLQPTAGEVVVSGRPAAEAVQHREVGIVFQQPILLPWKTALKNVSFLRELIEGRSGRAVAAARAQELLGLVGLSHASGRLPSELSGGMAQRVAIARALALDPKILLMDEPFGALDEITRTRMNLSLLEIWSRMQKTVLFVTHSIPEAIFLSDEVFVMEAHPGRIRERLVVDLPRPRTEDTLDDPRFNELASHLRHLLVARTEEDL
jgi:NitT/TauT family transport system ATP-binding protein